MGFLWKGKLFGSAVKAAAKKEFQKAANLAATRPSGVGIDLDKEFAAIAGLASGKYTALGDDDCSARDRIIVTTSFLAEQLKLLITLKLVGDRGRLPSKTEMREIFENYGPLASFADRISVCAGFGLIPDAMKNDLRVLKAIRNDFAAHTFARIAWDDPELAKECAKLKLSCAVDKLYKSENERRFVASAMMLMVTLSMMVFLISAQANVVNAHADEILRKGIESWNEQVAAKSDLPPIDVPPSSRGKSA